jgi:peptide/nickel transport system ATP-binding protein
MNAELLQVEGLSIALREGDERVDIVRDVNFSLAAGEILGVVGESGSGKTLTTLALLRLLPRGIEIASGRVLLDGRELTKMPHRSLRAIRGSEISMVFQDPMASLNPLFTIGRQMGAVLRAHRVVPKERLRAHVTELLRRVHLPDPEGIFDRYPHELSGGMRQRVMIATAISCRPRILIADEPTTALDVTVQSQILALLRELRDETGVAVIYISHDLAVVSQIADRVAVMYAGSVVEEAAAGALFDRPLHPYTQALLGVSPTLDTTPDSVLATIPGLVPHPGAVPAGCAFHPRCPYSPALAAHEPPPTIPRADGGRVVCHLYADTAATAVPDAAAAAAAYAEAR